MGGGDGDPFESDGLSEDDDDPEVPDELEDVLEELSDEESLPLDSLEHENIISNYSWYYSTVNYCKVAIIFCLTYESNITLLHTVYLRYPAFAVVCCSELCRPT